VTGTRIRWSDAPETVEVIGWVGTMASHVFTIWPPEEDGENGGEYLLTGRLPDHHGTRFYGTRDELKAEAEDWLERFVSSLGAVFLGRARRVDRVPAERSPRRAGPVGRRTGRVP